MTTANTRLDLMQSTLNWTMYRAIEYGWQGSICGILFSVATFRYRKAPYFMVLGIGVGSGMAFVEGNARLRALNFKQIKSNDEVAPTQGDSIINKKTETLWVQRVSFSKKEAQLDLAALKRLLTLYFTIFTIHFMILSYTLIYLVALF